jgi:L-ascorbate metabolism protein UlaG (beta-lactamase superfamily)
MARWKLYADWAKQRPAVLRVADRLGRSRGRLAVLDRLAPPPPAPLRPDLAGWAAHELAAVWVGHATVLLRVGGQTVLTDPVTSALVGLGMGLATAGPRRRYAAALDVRDLPPLDLILLSHAHFDHLDRPTLAKLPKRTPVVTSGHTADLLRDLGYRRVTELRWGESADVGPLRLTAAPVAHWGARTFFDTHRGYNAYAIEALSGPRRRVLFGGDTAYHDQWREVGKVDLAVVGIGAYDPYLRAHANPEQAWEMAGHVRADAVVPMHFGTFKLSYEPWDEPMQRLLAAAGGEAERVVVRDIGGQWAG